MTLPLPSFVGPGQSTLNNWEQFRPDYRERMKKQKETWDQYINKNGTTAGLAAASM